ncbi:MAG: dTDP-4-dehydrorhamnose 3,5-epimerase [Candidatus Firestonebacteria bacterium]|nr:dTDP-4-dehydrorhamnose 3,5-epimerase [Candidatus Firestonebacteria bacterium]
MKFVPIFLEDAYIIDPEPVIDERGSFARLFCKKEFVKIGLKSEIVQINQSITRQKGTIRGLHYQILPMTEMKIVKCIKGSVFDVIVDIRKGFPTFLKWYGDVLSEGNQKMIFIPKGFAHGFQTLEDNCEMLYFHTEFYSKEHDRGLKFNDTALGIQWMLDVKEISKKDSSYLPISNNFMGIEL